MSSTASARGIPLLKGGAIREFVVWYEALHGRKCFADVVSRLSGDARREVDPDKPALGILASKWYPPSVVFPVLDFASEGLDAAGRSKLARDGTDAAVRILTRGLYRATFRMVASPGLYARYIQRAWNVLHTTGRRTIVIERPGYAVSTITDWPGHHPLLCEITTETMRALFEAMGCTNVSVDRLRCVATGVNACRAIIHYDDPG